MNAARESAVAGSVGVLAVALSVVVVWFIARSRQPRMRLLPLSPRRGVRP
jgi:hypothetical protein